MLTGRLIGTDYSALIATGNITSWGTEGVSEQDIAQASASVGDLLIVFWAASGSTSGWPSNSTWAQLYTVSGFPAEFYGKFADGDATDTFTIPTTSGGHGFAQQAAFKVVGDTFGGLDTGGTYGSANDDFLFNGVSAGTGNDESFTFHHSIKTGAVYTGVNPDPQIKTIGFALGGSRAFAWGYSYSLSGEPAVSGGDWNPSGPSSSAGLYGQCRRQNIV